MKKILIINSSSKIEDSYSRKLANDFERLWRTEYPDCQIKHRDIGKNQIPHITDKWVTGAFKPESAQSKEEKEALALSDILVKELLECDTIVIASPMYNWSIPSGLKAYIDQVIRYNHTLSIDPNKPEDPYIGLVQNKQAYLLLVRGGGGYKIGEFNNHMEFQQIYLNTVLKTIGIEQVNNITMNLSAMGKEIAEKSYQETLKTMESMVKQNSFES